MSILMIQVTEAAAQKIKQNLARRGSGIGIRIGIRTTGCSGLAYVLEYVDRVNDEDTVFTSQDVSVIIDAKSLPILGDLDVDYVRQGLNEGFEFTNPTEKDRCGCGESFRI
jgi:iron-sulfur cluster assembly protein